MSGIDSQQQKAIARQHAWTSRLLGVDFMPAGRSPLAVTAASPRPVVTVAERQAARLDCDMSQGSDRGAVASAAQSDRAPLSRDEKRNLLDELRQRHDASCPHCTVATYHSRTVFGEGDPDARLMFIGEAPGEDEDRTGRPFVGRAGQKLNEIIKAMGFNREQVYIANVLKSRPPENRTPLPNEVAGCSPFLREQVQIIQPAAIVALGGPASKMLLKTEIGITRLRGQWGVYNDGTTPVPVMPTFHPAYLLRNYTKETRQQMWSDMQAVLQRLQAAATAS